MRSCDARRCFVSGSWTMTGPMWSRWTSGTTESGSTCTVPALGAASQRSARVCGYASRAAKLHGLDVIMRHYGGTGVGIPAEKCAITSVLEISIESLDGRWHGIDPEDADE